MILFRLCGRVPHVIRGHGGHGLARFGEDQHGIAFTGTEVFQVQRHPEILAHVKGPGQ
ncbi:hypothetical protein D3C84_1279700 [compost metagenome]